MTTRQLPFPARDLGEIVRAIQDETPKPIEKLNPKVPSELVRIIHRAMQKDRALRHQRASEMQHELQALLRRLESRVDNWKALMVTALILLLLALAAGAAVKISRVREWLDGKQTITAPRQVKSIAVLPFKNLTGDPSQDYFVDGMTDALNTNLTKLGSLRVISRTSTMHYKGTRKAFAAIAGELHVNFILEGSVARSGNRVRISARLVDASNDQNLWARDFDRDQRDVLQLQNELASAVGREVSGSLTPHEQSRLASSQVVNSEAYEAYLLGHYFSNRFDGDSLNKSVAYFQEAIRLDPNYAPAYAGLSENYSKQAIGWAGNAKDPEHRAIEAARKAISLDDSLAEAHGALAFVLHRLMQDWSGAEREFKRAIELNPNDAWAHHRYGAFQSTVGLHDPTCTESQLAHELDPLNTAFTSGLATCIAETGRFKEAVRMTKSAIEMEPDNPGLRWSLGEIYERKNMFPEALEQYKKGAEVSGDHQYMLTLMASAYAGWGKTDEAEKLLQKMNAKYGKDQWLTAVIYARMGRKEEAIRELVTDMDNKCGPGVCGPGASLFVSEWRFDQLRSDPRFQALLDLYNYPESARRE